jgi:hypothetical protein
MQLLTGLVTSLRKASASNRIPPQPTSHQPPASSKRAASHASPRPQQAAASTTSSSKHSKQQQAASHASPRPSCLNVLLAAPRPTGAPTMSLFLRPIRAATACPSAAHPGERILQCAPAPAGAPPRCPPRFRPHRTYGPYGPHGSAAFPAPAPALMALMTLSHPLAFFAPPPCPSLPPPTMAQNTRIPEENTKTAR